MISGSEALEQLREGNRRFVSDVRGLDQFRVDAETDPPHVSDPAAPKKTGSVHLGGIVRRSAHPKKPKQPLNGGPQMVEISRDGKRVYFTNSLYSPWDAQFYPDGIKSWIVKVDADTKGGMKLDERSLLEFEVLRAHQLRLEGGDASSDSYCYPDTR